MPKADYSCENCRYDLLGQESTPYKNCVNNGGNEYNFYVKESFSETSCDECRYSEVSGDEYPCRECTSENLLYEKLKAKVRNNIANEFDEVKKALHYNAHPSGVECKDVSKWFDNCRGQAIQYIWRCEEKGRPITDLKKAIYWLNEKINIYKSQGYEE